MRIAICDSDLILAQKLKAAVYTYAALKRLDLLVEIFPSGEALLKSNVRYRLLMIAYDLQGLNGLETAKRMKQLFFHSSVIFLGNAPHFVLESIEIHPLRILPEPTKIDLLYAALDGYFTEIADRRPLWIKNGCDTLCCTSGEILYLEADNKHCLVSLANKKVPCHKTMAHFAHSLPSNRFLKISRAYIVNLTHIESYSKKTVRLTNGETLPVTKKYYDDFISGFSAFCDPVVV